MRFFLVDQVLEITPNEFARGIKNISLSEDILGDHFPGFPVYPGSLIVEGMAQLGGFLIECSLNKDPDDIKRAMLVQFEKAQFHYPVEPGDQLHLFCRISSLIEGAAQLEGEATVNGRKVSNAELTYAIRKIDIDLIHEQRKRLYRQWTRGLQLDFQIL